MEISITGWALNSYLELKHARVFNKKEYEETLRPDALRLKNWYWYSIYGLTGFKRFNLIDAVDRKITV